MPGGTDSPQYAAQKTVADAAAREASIKLGMQLQIVKDIDASDRRIRGLQNQVQVLQWLIFFYEQLKT